jgi:cell division protein FtsL
MLPRIAVAKISEGVAAAAAATAGASTRFWLGFVALLAAVTLTALSVVYTTFTSRHLLNSLQELEKQRNQLQVEFSQLLLEQSSLVAQGQVEDTAIAELGMEVPDMTKVVVFTSE